MSIYNNKSQLKRIESEDCFEISAYHSGTLTTKGIEETASKIHIAFPKLFNGKKQKEITDFILLLTERIRANGFTDERFQDAVNNVIDNFTSWTREPSIADFISFDKKVKIYSPEDLMKKYKDSYYYGAKEDPINRYYVRVDIGIGEAMFALKADAEKYKMKLWTAKKPKFEEK